MVSCLGGSLRVWMLPLHLLESALADGLAGLFVLVRVEQQPRRSANAGEKRNNAPLQNESWSMLLCS